MELRVKNCQETRDHNEDRKETGLKGNGRTDGTV